VIYNDKTDVKTVLQRIHCGEIHNVVISPGPGTPESRDDVGLCVDLLRAQPRIPVLGVCLGFQALAVAHGGRVARAAEPVHGRLSAVEHTSHPLFADIPSGPAYQVVRYHSLVVEEESLPERLQAIAWCGMRSHALAVGPFREAGHEWTSPLGASQCMNGRTSENRTLMAMCHRELPHYGVQFHPESIGTTYGRQLLQNFRTLTFEYWSSRLAASRIYTGPFDSLLQAKPTNGASSSALADGTVQHGRCYHVLVRQVAGVVLSDIEGGTERIFTDIVLRGEPQTPANRADTFWLDSAATDRGRFSFMGGSGGPLWRRITYDLPDANHSHDVLGILTIIDAAGKRTTRQIGFWTWLEEELSCYRCITIGEGDEKGDGNASCRPPFDFWGGLVGYIGYEMKSQCGGKAAYNAATPDAALFFADRAIGVDHHTGNLWTLSVYNGSDGSQQAIDWIDATATAIQLLQPAKSMEASFRADDEATHRRKGATQKPVARDKLFVLRDTRSTYLANVALCMDALYRGDSYELCLTTQMQLDMAPDAWKLYHTLRHVNPAPYGAWLSFAGEDLVVCCSSPERFLRGDREGLLEAKPIKGTAPRSLNATAEEDAAAAARLPASEKDRAENLMIVDLLRNDLGRVCLPGTVHVPSLMAVESFATVHQLVSTVRGRKRPEISVAGAVRAAFPGGSMTGAPKLRSMEILDELEGGPRGIYSGSLGYFSINGAFDLNIVIRTAVVHRGRVSIGAGGAIVVQSNPDDEYEEMRLKAKALLSAIGRCDGSSEPAGVID
jgi:para-aminobenzoate synthetase